MYPPASRRAIFQPVPLMTNPGSLTMGFAGVHPRHSHIAICMNDNLYGVQDIRGSTSVDLSKGIVVCPLLSFYFFFYFFLFSIFWWPQWVFLFNSHLSSLGSFDFFLFGIFSSL